jgi:ribosome biogenesis GTPase A
VKLANWRLVRELLKSVDVALEVMDARDPLSTRSRKFETTAERLGVPILVVLNKADLVPHQVCNRWVSYFEQRESLRSVCVSARKRLGTRVLRRSITLYMPIRTLLRDQSLFQCI